MSEPLTSLGVPVRLIDRVALETPMARPGVEDWLLHMKRTYQNVVMAGLTWSQLENIILSVTLGEPAHQVVGIEGSEKPET